MPALIILALAARAAAQTPTPTVTPTPTATPNAYIERLHSSGTTGAYLSSVTIDDDTAIAYYDSVNDELKFAIARGGDTDGAIWEISTAYDGDGDNVGTHCSMAVVYDDDEEVNVPGIAFYNVTDDTVMYIRASWDDTEEEFVWDNDPVVVDSAPGAGSGHISLAVVDGHPAVAYYANGSNDNLKYCRATDPPGDDAWETPITIAGAGSDIVGEFASLAVVDGNPAVACTYETAGDKEVIYTRATNSTGYDGMGASTFVTPATVYTASASSTAYTSLAVVYDSGEDEYVPAIAFRDNASFNSVLYTRATTTTGLDGSNDSTFDTPVTVFTGVSGFTPSGTVSLTFFADWVPVILFFGDLPFGAAGVQVSVATSSDGDAWLHPQWIAQMVNSDADLCLTNEGPLARIAFQASSGSTAALWRQPCPGDANHSGGYVDAYDCRS